VKKPEIIGFTSICSGVKMWSLLLTGNFGRTNGRYPSGVGVKMGFVGGIGEGFAIGGTGLVVVDSPNG